MCVMYIQWYLSRHGLVYVSLAYTLDFKVNFLLLYYFMANLCRVFRGKCYWVLR